MKRTEIAQLATLTEVVVCDPYVWSKNPEKARDAVLVSCFHEKDGTHNMLAPYVQVRVGDETKFVMPNHVVGVGTDLAIQAARTDAADRRMNEAVAIQAAKDRLDAVLATFNSIHGITFSLARDARSASISVQDLVKLQVAIQAKSAAPQEEVQATVTETPAPAQETNPVLQAIREFAKNKEGWDLVATSYSDQNILDIVGNSSAKSAIKKMQKHLDKIQEVR